MTTIDQDFHSANHAAVLEIAPCVATSDLPMFIADMHDALRGGMPLEGGLSDDALRLAEMAEFMDALSCC